MTHSSMHQPHQAAHQADRSGFNHRLLLIALTLLASLLLAACGGGGEPEATPGILPAGEDGAILTQGPPVRRPSMGADVATIPHRLEIPSIRVETDVISIGWQAKQLNNGQVISEWEVANFAAGWHKNSATPVKGGNVVLSGHNNIRGAVFRKLYTLNQGDVAYLWAGGQRYAYEVEEVMILEDKFVSDEQRRANARWIQELGDDRLTLVSCWPEDDNTHRVVVVARPVNQSTSSQ
jgi:sortase A